jgi:hypothetical protein
MELSPDLARRGISPINDSLIEASRSVLVSHQPAAVAPSSPAASEPGGLPSDFAERARSDLRSMSQRLERLLRERREAVERARFRLRLRHQQHEEDVEEEELESEGGVLAPPAGLTGLGPAAEEGFHVTLGRNRSDIERWFLKIFLRVVDPH